MNLRLDSETLEYALRVTHAAAVIADSGSFSVRTLAADSVSGY